MRPRPSREAQAVGQAAGIVQFACNESGSAPLLMSHLPESVSSPCLPPP